MRIHMRIRVALLIACCLGLSACSMPEYSSRSFGEIETQRQGQLYNIRIERWGGLRFSGLLAVREQQDGLYYVMLDASGVKLIEAEVDSSGVHRLLHAQMGLKDSQLPEYLSTALRRVYLLEPSNEPCSSTLLLKFCREQSGSESQDVLKYLQAGPVTLWQVQSGNKGVRGAMTVYSQPWLGVRIYVEDFPNSTQ